MRISMIVLAALCVLMGLGGIWMLKLVLPVADQFLPQRLHQVSLDTPQTALLRITIVALVLIATGAMITVIRKSLLSKRSVREGQTWDCGYVSPTSRMQYTASSFAEPIIDMFRGVLNQSFRVSGLTVSFRQKQVCIHILTILYEPCLQARLRSDFMDSWRGETRQDRSNASLCIVHRSDHSRAAHLEAGIKDATVLVNHAYGARPNSEPTAPWRHKSREGFLWGTEGSAPIPAIL